MNDSPHLIFDVFIILKVHNYGNMDVASTKRRTCRHISISLVASTAFVNLLHFDCETGVPEYFDVTIVAIEQSNNESTNQTPDFLVCATVSFRIEVTK